MRPTGSLWGSLLGVAVHCPALGHTETTPSSSSLSFPAVGLHSQASEPVSAMVKRATAPTWGCRGGEVRAHTGGTTPEPMRAPREEAFHFHLRFSFV